MSFGVITIAQQNRNAHLFSSSSQVCRCHESLKLLPSHLRSTMDRLFSQVEDLEMFRYIQHRDNVVHAHEYRAGSGLFDSSGNCTVPLFELVRTFASRQCQNPRDRVFSLAAMATAPAYDAFVPDYQVDTVTCFIDMFRQMLEESSYDFRCFVGPCYGFSPDHPSLPSWVCDFSQPIVHTTQELRRLQVYNLYNSSGAKTGAPRIRNNRELHLSGVYVDTIEQVDRALGIRRTCVGAQAVFARWIRMCEHAIGSTDRERVRRAMVTVLCGTVVADWGFRRTRDKDGADEPCLLNGSEWLRLISGDLHGVSPAWETGFGVAVDGRCFFITKGGRMGLAVQRAKKGDEVWVPFGSRVPFVLRRLPRKLETESSLRLSGTHSFVEDCFLENAMDGEAVVDDDQGETIVLL